MGHPPTPRPAPFPVVSDEFATAATTKSGDLKPTTDRHRVFKSVPSERFGLAEATLERAVFPDSAAVAPLEHLTA